jgi:drug/metabolite transporter (DMT)-like permease
LATRARRGPTLALIGATVAVSFSAVFIRLANDDAATIVWVRMSMAAVLLAPLLLIDVKRGRVPSTSRSAVLVAVSGVFLAGHFLLWTASLQYTSIAASVLLVSMHPVAVIPLSRLFLRERTPPRLLIGMCVALAGTAITCIGDFRLSTTALAGDLLALGGAVCLAGYLLIGRGMRGTVGVATYSFAVYAVVAVIAAITALGHGIAHMPSARVALFGAGLAVICTIGGHTVYNYALRHVPAFSVSVAFLGEAPLTSLIALAVLATVPPVVTVIGGAMILIGVGLVVLAPAARRVAPIVALE